MVREPSRGAGRATVLVTHNETTAAACDRTLRLESGRLMTPDLAR